jgi:hypothetical protein
MASFVDAPRPEKFSDVHFKRWSVKVTDWLTAIEIFWVKDGLPKEISLMRIRVNPESLWYLCGSCA